MAINDDIRAIVREEILRILSAVASEPTTPDRWISLKDAVEPLGYPSYAAIHKDIQAGVFRMGKEVRDRRKPGAKIARLQAIGILNFWQSDVLQIPLINPLRIERLKH